MINKYLYGLIISLIFSCIISTSYGHGIDSGSGLISAPTASGGAPTTSTFITQTPDAGLSAEQALNALSDGLLKHASGVVAQAVSGTDYTTPAGTETLTNKTITDLSNMIHADAVHLSVRNISGATINKGQPVYISGYNVGEDKVEISLADADVAGAMPAIGLVEANILNNTNGQVLVSGILDNINTSSFSVGDILYISTTVGTLTATRPSTNGDLVQAIAKVHRSHASLGVGLVQGAGRTNDIPNNLTMINTGAFRTGVTAADTAVLAAYDVDGASYTTFATLTANNDPVFDLNAITTIGTNAIADSSDNLSFFSATTSAQLAGNLSDETGTLLAVFSDSPTFTTLINLPNTGLHILDTNDSHDLIIAPGSDITADRILTFTTGDAARTITLNGNPTLNNWFDQDVRIAASPTFAGATLTGEIAMGVNKITGLLDPTLDQDATTKIYVDTATASFDVDYFFNNTASDVGGIYFDMTSAALGGGESTLSTSGLIASTNDQALINFLTDETGGLGILDIPAGTFEVHFHAERTAGNSTVNIYAEIYKRASGGAETLITTSQTSGAVTSKAVFSLFAHTTADVDLLVTDRIVVKLLANLGSGSGATVVIYAEGTTVSRLAFPTTSEILNQIFLRQDGTKTLSGAWDMGSQNLTNVNIDSGVITGITDLVVADGGTGKSSAIAYAVQCGGTTSTAALQSIASVGTAAQVFTSNGPGALPTFQAAAGGGDGFTWVEKNGAYTAVAGDGIMVGSDTAAITITGPASASLGDTFAVNDQDGNAGTNNITIARNGLVIMGLSEDLILDINNQSVILVYSADAAKGWRIR